MCVTDGYFMFDKEFNDSGQTRLHLGLNPQPSVYERVECSFMGDPEKKPKTLIVI